MNQTARSRRPLLLMMGLTAVLLAASLGLTTPTAEAAPGAKLVGKWKATAMEVDGKRYPVKGLSILFEYKAGGKFEVVMTMKGRTKKKTGTWSATAGTLKMTVEGKTESMPYTVRGNKLTMKKRQGGKRMVHHMVRTR